MDDGPDVDDGRDVQCVLLSADWRLVVSFDKRLVFHAFHLNFVLNAWSRLARAAAARMHGEDSEEEDEDDDPLAFLQVCRKAPSSYR